MGAPDAAALAATRVEAVQESSEARYRLAADFYRGVHAATGCSRYGDAELSFLRWEIGRGVLDQPAAEGGGSPWWRAINDELLRNKIEAGFLAGVPGASGSSRNVELWVEFLRAPSAASWYRAHNASIVAGFLTHEALAASELPAERFMMNVALLRVLYAHALAAVPRLALGLLSPLGRLIGDPRRRSVRLFLDLRDAFPDPYPLDGWRLEDMLTEREGLLARAIDYGLIAPRLTELYEFASACLGEPRVAALIEDGTPCYAWPAEDRAPWLIGSTWPLARAFALATGRGRYALRPRLTPT